MRTIQESFEYFESYFRGEIDVQLGFEPFIFKQMCLLMSGETITKFNQERISKYVNQNATYFIQKHTEWMFSLAHAMHPDLSTLPDVFSTLDFLALWRTNSQSIMDLLLHKNKITEFHKRIISHVCELPPSLLHEHIVSLLCQQLRCGNYLGKDLEESIIRTTCRLHGFMLPDNMSDATRATVNHVIQHTPDANLILRKTYACDFFTRKTIGQFENTDHPILLLEHHEHEIWLHVFIEYAKLRCRDSWIYHMDDGDLYFHTFRHRYDHGLQRLLARIHRRNEWYNQWQTACHSYIATLTPTHREILLFVIKKLNHGTKLRTFARPETIGLDLSTLSNVRYQDLLSQFHMQTNITGDTDVNILTSMLAVNTSNYAQELVLLT